MEIMDNKRALGGLRVIECATLRAGPYCAKLLADLGAEVIKVEDPACGDGSRMWGPFPDDNPDLEKSGLFLWLNANKLGITVDLKSVLGYKVIKMLLKDADIFIEDFSISTAIELGLDYETLRKLNPRLVIASVTPFGQGGPYKDYKAYEINCSAAGGLSTATGDPEREPLVFPVFAADYQAGVGSAIGTLLAVLARGKTGRGQHVDTSKVEVLAEISGQYLVRYIYQGVTGVRRGNHGIMGYYPCSCLPCKDGYVVMVAPQLAQWVRFVKLMGEPEWSKDPRYRDRRRMNAEYIDECDAIILPWVKEHTKDEILSIAIENHLPFSPVQTVDELVNSPQLEARGFFGNLFHPEAGLLQYPGSAYKLSQTPTRLESPAPRLGEHNKEVLCDRLGYSEEELTKLQEYGVI